MTRTHRYLVVVVATLALAGCGLGGASTDHSPDIATTSHATSTAPHVVATLDVMSADQAVATRGRLWFLGGPTGVITQVDPATNTVTKVVTPPFPVGFGTYAGGSLWVASYLHNVVMQLDPDTGRVLRTIERSPSAPWRGPVGVAYTGSYLWVVNHNRPTLIRMDARTGDVAGVTRLPGRKAGSPLVAAGALWIAMNHGRLVVRVDPTTGQLDGNPVQLEAGACVASSFAAGELWFTSNDDEESGCSDGAERVDPRTGTASPVEYRAGRELSEFAELGSEVWASDMDHTLYRVDIATGTLTPTLTLDGGADANRLISAFGSLWVLRPQTNEVIRIDAG